MRECFESGNMMRGLAWCGLATVRLFLCHFNFLFLRHFVCLLFRHNRHLIAFINWYEVLNHRHDSPLLRFECIIIACGWMDWLDLTALYCFLLRRWWWWWWAALWIWHHGKIGKQSNKIYSNHHHIWSGFFWVQRNGWTCAQMAKTEMHCRTLEKPPLFVFVLFTFPAWPVGDFRATKCGRSFRLDSFVSFAFRKPIRTHSHSHTHGSIDRRRATM